MFYAIMISVNLLILPSEQLNYFNCGKVGKVNQQQILLHHIRIF